MPFIFIRVRNSQKYFALNVPKLKGHYDLTDRKLHHSYKYLENSFLRTELLHSAMSVDIRTVHISNNFVRLAVCGILICICFKCIWFILHPSGKLKGMEFNTDVSYFPCNFYLYSTIKHYSLFGKSWATLPDYTSNRNETTLPYQWPPPRCKMFVVSF